MSDRNPNSRLPRGFHHLHDGDCWGSYLNGLSGWRWHAHGPAGDRDGLATSEREAQAAVRAAISELQAAAA